MAKHGSGTGEDVLKGGEAVNIIARSFGVRKRFFYNLKKTCCVLSLFMLHFMSRNGYRERFRKLSQAK